MIVTESLRAGDLKYLVNPIVEIDAHKSKLGKDRDIAILAFLVNSEDPAHDLEKFIEFGYKFVLDADVAPNKVYPEKFNVFVEISRTRHLHDQILEILKGVKKLSNIEEFRFRFYKEFKSYKATREELEHRIPTAPDDYDFIINSPLLEYYNVFFERSNCNNIELCENTILFKSAFGNFLKYEIQDLQKTNVLLEQFQPVILEYNHIPEIMFLTKVIGNYNISKHKELLLFENNGYTLVLRPV